MNEARTHWKSVLMAINPQHLSIVPGQIVRAAGDNALGIPNTLYVTARSRDSKLQETLMFCNTGVDPDGNAVPDVPVIRDLYDDFRVISYHDLVGMDVECACLGSRIMGIKRAV